MPRPAAPRAAYRPDGAGGAWASAGTAIREKNSAHADVRLRIRKSLRERGLSPCVASVPSSRRRASAFLSDFSGVFARLAAIALPTALELQLLLEPVDAPLGLFEILAFLEFLQEALVIRAALRPSCWSFRGFPPGGSRGSPCGCIRGPFPARGGSAARPRSNSRMLK